MSKQYRWIFHINIHQQSQTSHKIHVIYCTWQHGSNTDIKGKTLAHMSFVQYVHHRVYMCYVGNITRLLPSNTRTSSTLLISRAFVLNVSLPPSTSSWICIKWCSTSCNPILGCIWLSSGEVAFLWCTWRTARNFNHMYPVANVFFALSLLKSLTIHTCNEYEDALSVLWTQKT